MYRHLHPACKLPVGRWEDWRSTPFWTNIDILKEIFLVSLHVKLPYCEEPARVQEELLKQEIGKNFLATALEG